MPTRARPRPTRRLAALALCAAGCASAPSITRAEVQALLDAQVERWNAGDLTGFVATYWDGPELTFLGSSGLTRGRTDLLANYQRGYPTPAARGVLSFEVLDFQPLGSDHALLLGRYRIQRAEPAAGVFTLVIARQHDGLAILHDHSSADP
jgi:hypothetical protein